MVILHFFRVGIGMGDHDKGGIGSDKDKILLEKEAELKRMQDMITAMQAKMQQQQ